MLLCLTLSLGLLAQEEPQGPLQRDAYGSFLKLSDDEIIASIEKNLEGVRYAVKDKRSRCSLEDFPNASEIIFAFEGAMGYCPASFGRKFDDETGLSLGQKLVFLEKNRKNARVKDLEKRFKKLKRKEWLKNCNLVQFLGYALVKESILGSHFNMVDGKRIYPNPVRRLTKKVLYYPWTDIDKARECLGKLRSEGHKQPVSAVGFSLGGYSAAKFAQGIAQDGETLKKLITLDPVKHGVDSVTSVLGRGKLEHSLSIPGVNAESWDNYYQRLDKNVFLLAGIRGRNYIEADQNFEILATDFETSEILVNEASEKKKKVTDMRYSKHAKFGVSDAVVTALMNLLYGPRE